MLGRLVGILSLTAILFAGIHYPLYAQSPGKAEAKMEAWVPVPGGTVWLEPTQAYEHNTGLVRDLRTGQKSYPITPQSLQQTVITPNVYWQSPQRVQPQQQVPCCPPQVAPQIAPQIVPQIVPNPLVINPMYPSYPVPRTYDPLPWYDLGPNNVYAPSRRLSPGYGASLDTRGEINQRWRATQLPR